MRKIVSFVSNVVISLKNVLESAHRNYGALTRETAEAVATDRMAARMNDLNGFGTLESAKLFMLSVHDLLLQFGRWENAGKVVWKAPASAKPFSGQDLSFMERLPFTTMFVEGPMHAFGKEAAGFFISGNEDEKRSMISFVFMKGDKLAYSRSIEIRYDRPRSCSLALRFPEAEASSDGIAWNYPVIRMKDVPEYELYAVRAEQTALGVLEAIYRDNLLRPVNSRKGHVAATPQGTRSVEDFPDFRFFGGTASLKGTGRGTKPGHGKGTPKAPHPVAAYPGTRWHRVPDDDMKNVPAGVETEWRTLKNGRRALYMRLPAWIRAFETGKPGKEGKKTPIHIRVDR